MARPMSASIISQPKLDGYVFTEKLGSGSYATVYKAYKKHGTREVVAVKCVLRSSLNKASSENLLREIELLKKLKHDNIVELKDFRWDDKCIYLIMEYYSGGDLSHFIRSKRALPEYIVKRFLQQIVKAMRYLREHNVAHMDLKPQNILMSSPANPYLRIADFGFAKHMFHGDELHAMRGSPLYMAPEIICKGIYDARVDIWSIGVILYECLFGRAPFASKNLKELQEKIWDSKPVELPYGVTVSDPCRDLLLRMLKRDPEKRISFDEFFNHPFVDLDHMPSNESLDKAVAIVRDAVLSDQKGDYASAVKHYCDSLSHFISAIHHEKNKEKKEVLRKKVKEYMDRAEELKTMMKPKKNEVLKRSSSTDPLQQLLEMYESNDEVTAALKVIKGAEIEHASEDYESALGHYELGLRTVIHALKEESKGKRKDLLGKQTHLWMEEAEKIQTFLSIRQLNTADTSTQEEEADNKYQGQCSIQ
ncbi:serine/threonine-protein kinase ULK3-like [Mizuhopecten yessoensis]|uniref:Serine/threonine-protein kinase ULK3 n=1 Tax=Mizuhopecten yessoensis TaxID=6573 RepID=A0A210PFI7_MIZYE|nr:serine/threonine-protein kinase ULK3-like [Mizuhopecten yessoensis]OWF35249.1 Serine/threonine-protein kinase ULK3 [Mizuhopecten yessoensis]